MSRTNERRPLAPLGLLLLASCQPGQPASGPARFDGVVMATVSAFTSTSDRCTFSFLFDNFRAEWSPSTAAKPGQASAEASRNFTLAASPGARGKTARFDIKGSYALTGPATNASAVVRIGGKDQVIALPDGGDSNEFDQSFEAVLASDSDLLPVEIRTSIAKPQSPDTQAVIDIDSVDVALVGCGSTRAAPAAPPGNSS